MRSVSGGERVEELRVCLSKKRKRKKRTCLRRYRSLAASLSVVVYIMYIVVHTVAAADLCILTVGGAESRHRKQPKDYLCTCVNAFPMQTWARSRTLLGDSGGILAEPRSCC